MEKNGNSSEYVPKNILIKGAAGFIASHVANMLLKRYPQYKIVVLGKLDYCSNLKNLKPSRPSPNFKFVKGDIGKNILITRAAGFIASHVANMLVKRYPQYKIVVLSKLDHCSNLKNLKPSRPSPNFKFVKRDIGKNILITRAAGFIASHVANMLVKRLSPNFKFMTGDIGSADLVNYLPITKKIDTIMHLAAQTHVDNSFGNSFEFTKNNNYGTHVLLEECKVTGQVIRFIHVSTDEVYSETEKDAIEGNH
ncbi:hypothetical protein SUGI_1187810 [Cryptomeria japonica]|nr:hypothetical protein SUGI_1187810 [Cryptomeria japonica]